MLKARELKAERKFTADPHRHTRTGKAQSKEFTAEIAETAEKRLILCVLSELCERKKHNSLRDHGERREKPK
jgi:hypothetical protein